MTISTKDFVRLSRVFDGASVNVSSTAGGDIVTSSTPGRVLSDSVSAPKLGAATATGLAARSEDSIAGSSNSRIYRINNNLFVHVRELHLRRVGKWW